MKIPVALTASEKPKDYSLTRFEELFGITYLKELTFADWKTEQWVKKACARAHKRKKIGELALWLGSFHDKELTEGTIPAVAVRWMHEKIGYGLFTTQPFQKWQFIGEYTGILRRRSLLFPDINDYCFMYPRQWLSPRLYTIDSVKHGNYTRFINHSDYPNCESVSVYQNGTFHILFRTIREIKADEELTYDYGGLYWLRRRKLKNNEKLEDLIPAHRDP